MKATAGLMGLMRGCIADGSLVQRENAALLEYIRNPKHASDIDALVVPKTFLLALERIAEGTSSSVDTECVIQHIQNVLGGAWAGLENGEVASTTLPLTSPAPTLTFNKQQYVFTGTMTGMTRTECEATVLARGGSTGSTVSGKTTVLVIGSVGSKAWWQSSYGRKIQKAVTLVEQGQALVIVSERQWIEALTKGGSGVSHDERS